MSHHIVGVFHTKEEAIRVIEVLKEKGYDSKDISVLSKNDSELQTIEKETDGHYQFEKGSKVKEGVVAGAAGGGLLGGAAGLLLGIGLFSIPGLGPLVAAGPLATALGGAAAGAGAGGIIGALVGMGIPEEDAKRYHEHVKEGKILVIVNANENYESEVYDVFISNNSHHSKSFSTGATRESVTQTHRQDHRSGNQTTHLEEKPYRKEDPLL